MRNRSSPVRLVSGRGARALLVMSCLVGLPALYPDATRAQIPGLTGGSKYIVATDTDGDVANLVPVDFNAQGKPYRQLTPTGPLAP